MYQKAFNLKKKSKSLKKRLPKSAKISPFLGTQGLMYQNN